MRKPLAVLASSVAAVVSVTAPASAATAPIAVGHVIHATKAGDQLSWRVSFTCPATQTYRLTTMVVQPDPPSIPVLSGEDWGPHGTATAEGSCTGHRQAVVVQMPIGPLTYYDRDSGQTVTRWVPVTRSDRPIASAMLYVNDQFTALYCVGDPCAGPGEGQKAGPRPVIR
jgi:hypothetical protein